MQMEVLRVNGYIVDTMDYQWLYSSETAVGLLEVGQRLSQGLAWMAWYPFRGKYDKTTETNPQPQNKTIC